jgi:hypothetical protein
LALPAGTNFNKINHFREKAGGEILVALDWQSAVSRIDNPLTCASPPATLYWNAKNRAERPGARRPSAAFAGHHPATHLLLFV